jgi:tRNA A-37 threonylcarbamoyl transferase component Bud32
MIFNLDNAQVLAEREHKVIYKADKFAVKMFDETFSKSDILNEALNHARVEETGLRVPALEDVEKINGKWAIVTEFIEGKTLTALAKENPDKTEEYLERFVDIQLEMHKDRAPMLNLLYDKLYRKIAECGLDASTRYDLHTRLESLPRHNKVCHGDLYPSNIIITPDDEAYILDWAHATQGNASSDAAMAYLNFCINGREKEAKLYLELFCKKSDTARQYVQKWLPIVAAAHLEKCNAKDREMLMSWIDVVDYE